MPIEIYRKHKVLQNLLFREGTILVATTTSDKKIAIVKLDTGEKITVPIHAGDIGEVFAQKRVRLYPRLIEIKKNGLRQYGLIARIYAKK